MTRAVQFRVVLYSVALLLCLFLSYMAWHWLAYHMDALQALRWLKPLARFHFGMPKTDPHTQLLMGTLGSVYFAVRLWLTLRGIKRNKIKN
ncbi:MAG TPA: hypothetical protein VN577_23360 [Terriglobales bacterium]|nr:hypothetical protein [Terriglobales bacterium]